MRIRIMVNVNSATDVLLGRSKRGLVTRTKFIYRKAYVGKQLSSFILINKKMVFVKN